MTKVGQRRPMRFRFASLIRRRMVAWSAWVAGRIVSGPGDGDVMECLRRQERSNDLVEDAGCRACAEAEDLFEVEAFVGRVRRDADASPWNLVLPRHAGHG